MKKLIFLSIICQIFVISAKAQQGSLTLSMTVNSIQPKFLSETVNPSATYTITSNSTVPINFKFNVTIYGDGQLLGQTDLNTAPEYTCNPEDFLSNLSPFDPEMVSLTSYNGFKESLLSGVEPIYHYHMCIKLIDVPSLQDLTSENCYDFTIQSYTAPSLIFPVNTSTVSKLSYQIPFKWNKVNPSPVIHEFYRLKLVKINAGQSASDAIANNTPVLLADSLADTIYNWRQTGDSIINDSEYVKSEINYAWQVDAYYITGSSFGFSSIFSFTEGNVTLISQGSTFDVNIATENAETLEYPDEEIGEYDTVQKTLFSLPAPDPAGQGVATLACDNGNWEHGDYRNWTAAMGTRDNFGNIILNTPGFDANGVRHHLITPTESPVFDDVIGNSIIPRVMPGGSYTMRLGAAWENNNMAQSLYFDYLLGNTNPTVHFNYALVMEGWTHNPVTNESEFRVEITGYYDANHKFIKFRPAINLLEIHANINDPEGLQQVADNINGHIFYKNWICRNIATPVTATDENGQIVNIAGLTVQLEFVTANCNPGGHYAYAYIDGICDVNDPTTASFSIDNSFCGNTYMIADATATFGAEDYYWSLQECDQNGNTLTGPEYNANNWLLNAQPGHEDIHRLFVGLGCPFSQGHYYKLSLFIRNNCTILLTSHVIYIENLIADAGPDKVICTGSNSSVTLGGDMHNNPTGAIYSWVSVPSGFTSSDPNPTLTPTGNSPITYILTVKNQSCTLTDTCVIYFSQPITDISLNDLPITCTGHVLSVSISPSGTHASEIVWKINGTTTIVGHGQTITVDGYQDKDYSVDVTDACGHHFTKTISTQKDHFSVDPNLIVFSYNYIVPAWHNPLKVWDWSLPDNAIPAYGANKYVLNVYNSWGTKVKTVTGKVASGSLGFANGIITWDGTDNSGNALPSTLTSNLMRLSLYQCSTDPTEVKFHKWICHQKGIPFLYTWSDCSWEDGKGNYIWILN
jgi:hypothetical protein